MAHRVGARLGIPATGYQSDSMKDSKQEELIEEESRWVESKILPPDVPLFPPLGFGEFGLHMTWDVFDFGKRRSEVRMRETQLAEAEENLRRMKDDVATAIEKTYNKLEKAKSMVVVANQVVELRKESERLAENQMAQGEVLSSARSEATAASYKAQADYLNARLGYLLAWAELQQQAGITPGL